MSLRVSDLDAEYIDADVLIESREDDEVAVAVLSDNPVVVDVGASSVAMLDSSLVSVLWSKSEKLSVGLFSEAVNGPSLELI